MDSTPIEPEPLPGADPPGWRARTRAAPALRIGEAPGPYADAKPSLSADARAAGLLIAAEAGDLGPLQDAIGRHEALDEARDARGRTPLMLAALHGRRAAYALLLGAGASLDARDGEGIPAIEYVHAFGALSDARQQTCQAALLRALMLARRDDGTD